MDVHDEVKRLLPPAMFCQFLTEIWQSDHNVGEGACRGLASMWLGAHKSGVKHVADFRKLAEKDIKSLIIQGNTKQNNLEHARREFDECSVAAKAAIAAVEALDASAKAAKTPAERAKFTAPLLAAIEEFERKQKQHANALMIILALEFGTLEAIRSQHQEFMFYRLKAFLFETLGAGLHYVSLGNHTIAFFLQDKNSPGIFFDANSGEFRFGKGDDLELFFMQYMDAVYPDKYSVIHPCSATTTAGDKATLEL